MSLSGGRPVAMGCGDEYWLLYPPEVIAPYFKSSTDQQIAHFVRSLEAANEFLREHPKEGLVAGKGKPKGLAGALQYFKDEMFLTLYAFISLDLAGRDAHLAERERLLTELLHLALPHLDISVKAPSLELEKQVSPPRGYSEILRALFSGEPESCHPVWYLRALGTGNGSLEGATHSDAMLTYEGNRTVMFEAKFLSDISASTTYAPERDQSDSQPRCRFGGRGVQAGAILLRLRHAATLSRAAREPLLRLQAGRVYEAGDRSRRA